MNLTPDERDYLTRIPREMELVNAWLQDMPIWELYKPTPIGVWTRSEAECLIETAVDFLQHEFVSYSSLIILTGNCFRMLRAMLLPEMACTDENLLGDMTALVYQLVSNVRDSGFNMMLTPAGSDLETAPLGVGIYLVEYPADDEIHHAIYK